MMNYYVTAFFFPHVCLDSSFSINIFIYFSHTITFIIIARHFQIFLILLTSQYSQRMIQQREGEICMGRKKKTNFFMQSLSF